MQAIETNIRAREFSPPPPERKPSRRPTPMLKIIHKYYSAFAYRPNHDDDDGDDDDDVKSPLDV